MKIGVWLGFDLKESAGGAFSYTDRLIQLIDEHKFPEDVEICFLSLLGIGTFSKPLYSLYKLPRFLIRLLRYHPLLYRIYMGVIRRKIRRYGIGKRLAHTDIKLIYYIQQGEVLDSNFPFIVSNWDIGHRSTHAFPELMWDGKPFEKREFFYRNILPKALMVFCDSETGREELIQYTNIGEHKLRVFPLFGGSVTTVKIDEQEGKKIVEGYGLKENSFYFYPSQFWAHKNHYNLINAFARVTEKYPQMKLVLSGSDKGNKGYIQDFVSDNGLQDKVVFLGFVPIETLYCMYKYATALVMASHFGPTNMPPIEAMEIGCPVACSDLGGHREILGDAAVYFDSYDVESMTNAMIKAKEQHSKLVEEIRKQSKITQYNTSSALNILDKLLVEVVDIRACWR